MIIEGLEKYLSRGVQDGTRRNRIIEEILEMNQTSGRKEEVITEIKRIFHANPRSINQEIISQMEALGLVLTLEGKHYKVSIGGEGITATIPSTPGDSRSGKNSASNIIKSLL